jgi:hypothetical protein
MNRLRWHPLQHVERVADMQCEVAISDERSHQILAGPVSGNPSKAEITVVLRNADNASPPIRDCLDEALGSEDDCHREGRCDGELAHASQGLGQEVAP